jgi:hypothetical protein
MAKIEQDREDLMREAKALSPRAEIATPAFGESVVFGFRSSGGISLFFGADPVYQFNSVGELRRAYVNGELYKAHKRRLEVLQREKTSNQVTLWRTELDDSQQSEFLAAMQSSLERLEAVIAQREFNLVEEFPAASNAIDRLHKSLAQIGAPPRVAERPNVI